MKKKMFSLMKNMLVASIVFMLFNSCTEEYITREYTYYVNPEGKELASVHTEYQTIYAKDWTWLDDRYVAFIPIDLYDDDYESASVKVDLFRWENGVERLTALPYIRTYFEEGYGYYTETFSYEVVFTDNRRGIYFYIQESTHSNADYAILDYYEVKLSITYNL